MNNQNNNIIKKSFYAVIVLATSLALVNCSDSSDVGDQTDVPPVADATVLGASATAPFNVRSGSEVLISGKDSDGIDDPLLKFEWTVASVSGASITIADIEAALTERTTNTKAFSVPMVSTATTVEFKLTVTDADGVTASDSVQVTIEPVGDANFFLTQGAVSNNNYNKYELVVALDLQPGEITASSFEILIETIAEWEPRGAHPDCVFGTAGNRCQMLTDSQTLTGSWPPGITEADVASTDFSTAFFNPHYFVDIPSIDVDDINQPFEKNNRDKRLELDRVDSATLTQRFSFVSSDNSARLAILAADGATDSELVSLTSLGASEEINVDAIRQAKAIESRASANAYYQLIDPNNDADILSKWLSKSGFVPGVESEQEFAHAIYLNNYDLGFGRDMFMRTDECGNVYSYVENYPTLETAIQKRNNFATVVMEYSPLDPEAGETCSDEPKFVKFYAYVPNETTGEQVRMPSMNFDGRGEKFLPGVCTACHGGGPNGVDGLTSFLAGLAPGADVPGAIMGLSNAEKLGYADVNASFMPFDLDSFLYTQANDASQVETTYSRDDITAAQIEQFSRETQLDDFRTLNKAALTTFLDKRAHLTDPTEQTRWDAPIELVNSFYGTSINAAADIDLINAASFDGTVVLPGWTGNESLHNDVFARYCRACHIQLENTDFNFDTFDEFIDPSEPAVAANLEARVFQLGKMPLARLTSDRFWVDFDGNESAASILQTALGSTNVPGLPIAGFEISNAAPDEIGQTITLDASLTSGLAAQYQWSLASDCGSSPFLVGANTALANFVTDTSPCEYTVLLNVENLVGTDETSKTVLVDRIPEAVNLAAPLDDPDFLYTPGDAQLVIDIDSQIVVRGDNDSSTLNVIINDAADPDLNINESVVNNNDGTVTITFPALMGTVDNFNYKVSDLNNSVSINAGVVTVNIDPIIPSVQLPRNVSASSATIDWTVPAGFVADGYNIFRDGAPLDSSYTVIGTTATGELSFTDNTLAPNQNYRFVVSALLGADESEQSDFVPVTTSEGVPSLMATAVSTSSISLSWTISAGDAPSDYDVIRDGATIASAVAGTTFTDMSLIPNKNYSYQIVANFASNSSVPSAAAAAATLPAAPTALAASSTTNSITLTWADTLNDGSPTYQVFDSNAPTGQTTTGNSIAISGLNSNTNKSYTIRATGLNGTSGNSNTVSTSTLVSYNTNVFPIINTARGGAGGSCAGCHGTNGNFTVAGTATVLFNELKGITDGDSRVVASDDDDILECVNSGCNNMKETDTPAFSASDTSIITKWLNEGALNN